ncbi:hypothetical protein [Nocardioides jiangxiensis]|uniref:Uncharacterized protein n=1 Tax=Nocardioides jiangxiensis TaxID=3064524 RepID=A0ABT9B2B7_9ACTN|nr:hypothetical protein [Nocardioides sp. WY-20]MDO7867421.1 hypothetical protein [Nocardioides sp. WY-20]
MRDREADPFLRINSPRYVDIVTDGVVEMPRECGVDAVTMRALAAWMKVTPSALSHRAGWPDTLLLIVEGLGRRWIAWSTHALAHGGQPALPRTVLERHGVRVWAVVRELAATAAVQGHRDALERWHWFGDHEAELVLEWWRAAGRPEAELAAFRALIDGTRLALAFDPALRVADAECLFRDLTIR